MAGYFENKVGRVFSFIYYIGYGLKISAAFYAIVADRRQVAKP